MNSSTSNVSILSMWNYEWIIYVIILAVIYLILIGPLTRKFGDKGEQLSRIRMWSFFSGLFLLFLAYGSPISELGHTYLFSAHMTSMALIYLAMPPLLLVGTPAWLARKVISLPIIGPIVSFMTRPLIAILFFNIFFSIYHVPIIFNQMTSNMGLHMIYHYALIMFAFFMWWPVFCPVPEKDGLSELQKMGYIFANGVLLTPACALIIFSERVIYSAYIDAPQLFAVLPTVADQQLGGVIMKIMQEIVYGCALGFVFYQWVKKQKKQDKEEENNEVSGYGYLEVTRDPLS
ncbi:putative membrane protein [Scopulibacillus darangshiensis]|uniref:Putative membrane protein n=1 Tax=Scopulibacillus darangshiensis TaxID=442528 RepID=A0A4R2P6V7_9BACL|nr:cytochrome c oxidase assembly protein [Scopulibacillus darangshiensis]TCP30497.1 putative membrane protein [Scopulibacillus darangshiensis]